jgi:hypothetical protein
VTVNNAIGSDFHAAVQLGLSIDRCGGVNRQVGPFSLMRRAFGDRQRQ